VPPVDVMEAEARRPLYGHFTITHHATALRADVYPSGDDPLHAWALPLARVIHVRGEAVRIDEPIDTLQLGAVWREVAGIRRRRWFGVPNVEPVAARA
jgi:hypothetical protein